MFGKQFASMYTGSMFGQPALVFAVMGYVISNQRPGSDGECRVELNPLLLAPMFSVHPSEVVTAISTLESPDPISRSADHDGRRLIRERGEIVGPAQYLVVNGAKYRAIKNEADRREYMRGYMRKYRAEQIPLPGADAPVSKEPKEQDTFDRTEAFAAIWTQLLEDKVPTPVAKKVVLRHFNASVKNEDDLVRFRTALVNYQTSRRVARGFVQNASTWFNDWQQWVDGDPAATRGGNGQGGMNARTDRRPTQSDPRESPKPRGMRARDFGHRTAAEFLADEAARKLREMPDAAPPGTADSVR